MTLVLLSLWMPAAMAQGTPSAGATKATVVRPAAVQSIGPKQDDPRARGIVVQGGLQPDCEDPDARRGTLAIGPKQDDPRSPAGASARPGDDEDPQASPHGTESIGPKQDDPRSPAIIVQGGRQASLAIGPKQDDPRAPAAAMGRPGDDNDPKARCKPKGR